MAETVVCITNNTGHLINLAPQPGLVQFPEGIKLIPGLNRVPVAYMKAWTNRKVPVMDTDGKPVTVAREVIEDVQIVDDKGKVKGIEKMKRVEHEPVYRFPGQDEIKKLTEKTVRIVTSNGKHMGPVITIHEDGEISPHQPEGPPPPVDLPENVVHAMKLIEVTHDRKALQLWHDFDPRDVIKAACQRQLQGGGRV